MNRICAILFFLGLSWQSFAAPQSCTLENSQKLLSLAAKFVGEAGADEVKLSRVILDQKITDSKEIRKQLLGIKKKSKAGAAAEELMTFAEAHPECDKEGNFRIVHPYK